MNSKNLIICDPEEGYAQALAMYFMQKKDLFLQVYVCSSPQRAIGLGEEVKTDFLLISEDYEENVRKKLTARKVFILTSQLTSDSNMEYPVIYKYQSGESILTQLFAECSEWFDSRSAVCRSAKDTKKKIIGVFSPIHRIGKTSYALNLGEKLAESENVLYLNLEFFGGLDGHFENSDQTISDMIYYSRQEKGNFGTFLTSIVCHKGNLDYVAPASVSEDMKEMKDTEWISLIEKILQQSIYETVILDIDEGISGLYQILEECTEIYMPVLENPYAKAKISQFEQELKLLGKEHIMNKIIWKEARDDYGGTASFQDY